MVVARGRYVSQGWWVPEHLFHGRNKLATRELSCLSSLVLAALQGPSVAQKLQIREGCYAARPRLLSAGGSGAAALPRATGKGQTQPRGHLPRMIGQVPLPITGVPGHKLTGLSLGLGDMPGSQSRKRLQPSTTQQQGLPVPPRAENTGAMPPQPHPTHAPKPAFCLQMEGAEKGVCSPHLPTRIPQGHTPGETSATGECDLSSSQLAI